MNVLIFLHFLDDILLIFTHRSVNESRSLLHHMCGRAAVLLFVMLESIFMTMLARVEHFVTVRGITQQSAFMQVRPP